jgi:hypothetical protein
VSIDTESCPQYRPPIYEWPDLRIDPTKRGRGAWHPDRDQPSVRLDAYIKPQLDRAEIEAWLAQHGTRDPARPDEAHPIRRQIQRDATRNIDIPKDVERGRHRAIARSRSKGSAAAELRNILASAGKPMTSRELMQAIHARDPKRYGHISVSHISGAISEARKKGIVISHTRKGEAPVWVWCGGAG